MLNPATKPQDETNSFTQMVLQFSQRKQGWESYWIRLRNDVLVRPEYFEPTHETENPHFFDDYHRWNLDGSSITRSAYDMMEIIEHDGS